MIATYGGTRIGRQELDGELMRDGGGALWPRAMIERSRRGGAGLGFDRIVVGVDPPAGASDGAMRAGSWSAGRPAEQLYVLADASVAGLSPEGWASRVAPAAARWNTAQVVAEANNGGAMVESVLQGRGPG